MRYIFVWCEFFTSSQRFKPGTAGLEPQMLLLRYCAIPHLHGFIAILKNFHEQATKSCVTHKKLQSLQVSKSSCAWRTKYWKRGPISEVFTFCQFEIMGKYLKNCYCIRKTHGWAAWLRGSIGTFHPAAPGSNPGLALLPRFFPMYFFNCLVCGL